MKDLLDHPWVRVLLLATTVAMCSWALQETSALTLPVVTALGAVLLPVAIGFTIAYVLTPVVDALTRRGLPRPIAAGVLFFLFCVSAVLGVSLVVPTVLRQSANLTTRLFQGESFTDLNHNGVWDPGEPYVDANGNGRYDGRGMLDTLATRVEDLQERLRRLARLDLDAPALAFLDLYLDETVAERTLIDGALAVARDGRGPEQWPAGLRREPPADAPPAWNPAWPGAQRSDVDDAYGHLLPEVRERWLRNLAAAGAALAAKQDLLLAALRAARDQGTPDEPRLAAAVERLRAYWQRPVGPESFKVAKGFAARLGEAVEKDGQPAARQLLDGLRGGEGGIGTQWLGPLVKSLEDAVHSEAETLPARLGGWMRGGLGNIDQLLAFTLDVLLVPIYAFFMILAMPAIRRGVKEHIPLNRRDQVLRIAHDIERVVAAFFRGRIVVCLICAGLTYIGFVTIGIFGTGVPYAALFGLAIGLATAVPLAGILFLVPAVVLTMIEGGGPITAGAVIGVYLAVQALETVVLTPTIMGREVELHPVTLIVALLLCGKLIGVLGVIMAVPIAATCRILAREYLWPRLRVWAERHPPRPYPLPEAGSGPPPAGP